MWSGLISTVNAVAGRRGPTKTLTSGGGGYASRAIEDGYNGGDKLRWWHLWVLVFLGVAVLAVAFTAGLWCGELLRAGCGW